MNWKASLDRLAGRTNPYLARLAIGLAMLVVLMMAAERNGQRLPQPQTPATAPSALEAPPERPSAWHTD